MQERYLGDIHDYYKFIFLKFLSKKLHKSIGLNWYLVDPSELGLFEQKKNDGEKRNYLFKKNKFPLDKQIIEELLTFREKKDRKISIFTKNTHLKNHINFFNYKLSYEKRDKWHSSSILFFKNQDVVFLDPDNGIKKNSSIKNKRLIKYVIPEEIVSLKKSGKTIIFTQFQSFNESHIDLLRKINNLILAYDLKINCPIIRNRTSPNTFFLTIAKDSMKSKISKIYKKYSDFNSNTELIEL